MQIWFLVVWYVNAVHSNLYTMQSWLKTLFAGKCKWIRTPAIIYSVHVATTLIPILGHILLHNFPLAPLPGPQTSKERWTLVCVYAPYLLIPLTLLLTMLSSSTYNSASPSAKASSKTKKLK